LTFPAAALEVPPSGLGSFRVDVLEGATLVTGLRAAVFPGAPFPAVSLDVAAVVGAALEVADFIGLMMIMLENLDTHEGTRPSTQCGCVK
jgi:hypothetical protein